MTDIELHTQIAEKHGLVGEDKVNYSKLVLESIMVVADSSRSFDAIDPLFNEVSENVRVTFLDYLKVKDEQEDKEFIMYECAICGYKNQDKGVIDECESLGIPEIELLPGDRVCAYEARGGEVLEDNIRRYNHGWHNPHHLRWYLIRFDDDDFRPNPKWLTLSVLTPL